MDLVQFYWHNYQVPKYVATSQYLMEEAARGSIKHLGVTNFDVPRMQQMMSGGAEIVSNQVQHFAWMTLRLDDLLALTLRVPFAAAPGACQLANSCHCMCCEASAATATAADARSLLEDQIYSARAQQQLDTKND